MHTDEHGWDYGRRSCAASSGPSKLAYTQRQADTSPLWALVNDYGEVVERVWEEKFEGKYGPWRPHRRRVLAGFLECGDLECGFARVRCGDCGNEYLVPFPEELECGGFSACEARRRATFGPRSLGTCPGPWSRARSGSAP